LTPDIIDVPVGPHGIGECTRIARVLQLVGDKWTVLIVMQLGLHGTVRFNELKRLIGGITQRMLTLTLRSLERDGMVARRVYPTVPPKVEYALTPLGKSLLVPISHLGGWAREHMDAIDDARSQFDQAQQVAAE
jgi:DNA-binding HxlR family transcriptional regulator